MPAVRDDSLTELGQSSSITLVKIEIDNICQWQSKIKLLCLCLLQTTNNLYCWPC